MIRVLFQLCTSFLFLAANVAILLWVLDQNRRSGAAPSGPPEQAKGKGLLEASDILHWEFEYARITASEAMQDRHTMVNFYLLAVGVVASGVVAVIGQAAGLPKATGTVLLWLLCGVGWLYFLKLIRLRQAWHDSARTMNQIKEFYIRHAADFDEKTMRTAFRWQAHTLPPPGKPWTVFYYSATLIALLDSVAYVAGGALLGWAAPSYLALPALGLLTLLGLAFFAFHEWLYFTFLR
jgi:hypothetical protein